MKLVFDAERLRNLNSGLGQLCRALGRALMLRRPADAEVRFIVPASQRDAFGPEAAHTTVAWWHRYRSPAHADVWHMTHQDAWIRPPGDARVVLTILDLNFLERADYSEAKKARRLAAVQRKMDRAAAITTISEYTASVVRAHLRVPDVPLRPIHLGNPVDAVNAPAAEAPGHPALRALAPGSFFLFVGVLHPKKNVHVLLPVLREFPAWTLVMAGPDDHPYAGELRDRARALGVDDRVIIPGPVDESTKRWLYAHCGGLVFPSLSEGFGLPVVEAMSFGKPVFLSRLTSLPEVGGPLACYFDGFAPESMARTIRAGLADFAAHPEREAELRNAAARFNWDRAATEYWSLYREMLRSHGR